MATDRLHLPFATAIAASMVAPQLSRTEEGVLWLMNSDLAAYDLDLFRICVMVIAANVGGMENKRRVVDVRPQRRITE